MDTCETCGGLIEGGTPFSRNCDACINTCKNCHKQFISKLYVHECETCQNEIREAVKTVMADLEWYNAHTLAALLDNHYNGNYDNDKALKAYKAAQFELFGTN